MYGPNQRVPYNMYGADTCGLRSSCTVYNVVHPRHADSHMPNCTRPCAHKTTHFRMVLGTAQHGSTCTTVEDIYRNVTAASDARRGVACLRRRGRLVQHGSITAQLQPGQFLPAQCTRARTVSSQQAAVGLPPHSHPLHRSYRDNERMKLVMARGMP